MKINNACHRAIGGSGHGFFYFRHRRAVEMPNAGIHPSSTAATGADRRPQNQSKPSILKPVQFVPSGCNDAPKPESAPIAKSAGEIGSFEIHTRGIGSRLMAKMGYVPGKGLGKNGQGISAPIELEHQHDKLGVGFFAGAPPADTAAWLNWESQRPPPADASASAWPSWKPPKKKQKTAAHVTLANPWAPEIAKVDETAAVAPPPEKVGATAENDIEATINDLRRERDLAARALKEKKTRQSAPTSKEMRHLNAMKAIIAALKGAKKHAAGVLTLDSLLEMFTDLKKQFTEEFEMCNLSSVASALAYPLLVEVFWGWKPVEEDMLQGLAIMSSWKDLLLLKRDCSDDASAYGRLVRDVVLPVVKEWGANSWDARNPQPMILFLELWELLLPETVRNLILEEVVMTKLLLAVESWDPRRETTPIHVWVHPWIPILGKRLESVYETIQFKMGIVLNAWKPSDQSAFNLLSPWKYVFDSVSWEKMIMQYIIPKLKKALQNNQTKLDDQFNWAMRWESVIQTDQMVALLEDGFFSNWLKVLELWLSNSDHDPQEVRNWYEGWKERFSPALLSDERIQMLLCTALSRIDQEEIDSLDIWDELYRIGLH